MGIYCKKCKKHKVPLMAALASLTSEGARCESCGEIYIISGVSKLLYLTIESAVILLSVYISFYLLTAVPLNVGIAFVFFARLFLLPHVASSSTNKQFKN